MNGFSKEGPVAYHIDVQKVGFGWNVLIHKGPDTQAPCIMKLTKKKAIWDKNAEMVITVSWPCLMLFSQCLGPMPWPGWMCSLPQKWP